jgi:hypothetical protein
MDLSMSATVAAGVSVCRFFGIVKMAQCASDNADDSAFFGAHFNGKK